MSIKEILNRRKKGVDFILGDDLKYCLSILKNNPSYIEKVGVGIKSVFTNNTKYGNRCFFIERLDGSVVDISYTKAIYKTNKLTDIKKCCRTAIMPVIKEFKCKNFNGICSVTGELISFENTHVDHYDLTFNELFNIWIKDKDIKKLYENIKQKDGIYIDYEFIDEDTVKSFVDFHNNNTNLRCVSAKYNLSRK